MNDHCPSCGGAIGRDCFNPQECAEITRQMDYVAGMEDAKDAVNTELMRLRSAVAYCRMRLKRPGYRDHLDAILRGDKDDQIRNPDRTPVVLSDEDIPW